MIFGTIKRYERLIKNNKIINKKNYLVYENTGH